MQNRRDLARAWRRHDDTAITPGVVYGRISFAEGIRVPRDYYGTGGRGLLAEIRTATSRLTALSAGIPPRRLTAWQIQRNLTLALTLRWATAALAAMVGLLVPSRPMAVLVPLVIAVAIYNALVTVAIRQADDARCRQIARLTWVADQFFAFVAVAIFSGQPEGAAPYMFVTLEAVFYEGLVGGVISAALFAVLEVGFQFGRHAVAGTPVLWPELISFITLIGLAAAAFVGVTNILLTREPPLAESNGHKPSNGQLPTGIRLTRRELEIVQLMASGYSNAMIASRLHLSESTIKSYVEVLLGRLNVRNRTEAVAAASRLKLL